MIWLAFCCILALYVALALLVLLIVPASIAKPPWHAPKPGQTLSEQRIPAWWHGATNPHQLNLTSEDVSFSSYANLTLRGWLISPSAALQHENSGASPSEVAIVCVHGAGRDRRAFLRHSVFLAEAGYDVLLFDCSNHGVSDSVPAWPMAKWPGRAVSLGTREHLDVVAAVEFLEQRGARSVVVFGTSQGASASIIAAARCDQIKLLILENPFVSPTALVEHVVQVVLSKVPIPFFQTLLKPFVTWLSLLRTGNAPSRSQFRAIDYIRDLKVPMFFIHGTGDKLIHHSQSQELYNMATCSEKALWLVEDAEHTRCYMKDPLQYERRVLEFLDIYMRSNCTHEESAPFC